MVIFVSVISLKSRDKLPSNRIRATDIDIIDLYMLSPKTWDGTIIFRNGPTIRPAKLIITIAGLEIFQANHCENTPKNIINETANVADIFIKPLPSFIFLRK